MYVEIQMVWKGVLFNAYIHKPEENTYEMSRISTKHILTHIHTHTHVNSQTQHIQIYTQTNYIDKT